MPEEMNIEEAMNMMKSTRTAALATTVVSAVGFIGLGILAYSSSGTGSADGEEAPSL